MSQVERFKHRQNWEDALHSRFDCHTGDEVMDHDSWGHLQVRGQLHSPQYAVDRVDDFKFSITFQTSKLQTFKVFKILKFQIDSSALFLLMVAQMTASGVQVWQSLHVPRVS